jgi:hypothetical protein
MPLRSIQNHHGFFSDYWLGTILSGRGQRGPKLTAPQARRFLTRITRLVDGSSSVSAPDLTRFRERFARPLLYDVFGFVITEHAPDPRIRTLIPIQNDDPSIPTILAALCPEIEELETRQTKRRLEDALLSAHLDYGLIISPETLRLVRGPGLGPRGAAFDFRITSAVDLQDEESVSAAYRVLSAHNFVRSLEGTRPIDLLEAESRQHSARVSNELKTAVFEAAERIVSGFLAESRAHVEQHEPRLRIDEIRDAGFLVLYRLLFILYAEARDERLLHHRLYQRNYSLDSLVSRLLQTPPEQFGANRYAIWARLIALFTIFNEGIAASLPDLDNIPPRGGRLFSNVTLDGQLLLKLRLDDRTAAQIVLGLSTTRPRRGVGRERVSFRELAIEQLGSVYEGLLEYEPAEASETLIELELSGRELALNPTQLVQLCEQKRLTLRGEPDIVAGTVAGRLHPDIAAEAENETESEEELENGDEEDEEEAEEDDGETGVKRGATLRLLRRFEAGSFFFKPGSARKSSGSYYTPTPMVDYIVREALGPLINGRSPAEIERLRVIDLACGSAHFLVGAARFLGAKLFEAYRQLEGGKPPGDFYPDRSLSSEVHTRWESDGPAWCKRRIVERCLFGVDLNPYAVQLAQVALWIESLAGDRPLSFFAHHIRIGNSLLASRLSQFDSPPDPNLAAFSDRHTKGLFERDLIQRIEAAFAERRLIDAPLPPDVRGDTPEEYAYKEDRLRRAEVAVADARLLLDLRSASPFVPEIWRDFPMLVSARDLEADVRRRVWWPRFETVRSRERFFHWEVEFPEVFLDGARPGFDAVIGNPPWDKMLPNKHEFYGKTDALIRAYKGNELEARIRELHNLHPGLAEEFASYRERITTLARVMRSGGDFPLAEARSQAAHEDVAKYFVDSALCLVRSGGFVGLVVPSVLYNGDGCVGIRRYLVEKATIKRFYGFENRRKIFPIDSRYKFANLIVHNESAGAGNFTAAFMRQDLSELEQEGTKPWQVQLSRDDIVKLSPETYALLEFRNPRDQQIVRKMSNGRPTLGATTNGAWGARLMSWRAHEAIFNSSEDKDQFTDPATGNLYTPKFVLGRDSVEGAEVVGLMREKGFWPVFEGKHIEQFLAGIKPIRWWLSLDQVRKKYGHEPRREPTLVFRETASNTNERTCIAAVLPARSAGSHKLTGIVLSAVDPNAAMTVLNSFCFDFALRLRTAGTNVSFTYILPVAVPSASATNGLPTIPTRIGWESGIKHISDDQGLWPELWKANRAVAEAYGLDADDLSHIIATFPVFARKRPKLHAFFSACIADWRAYHR